VKLALAFLSAQNKRACFSHNYLCSGTVYLQNRIEAPNLSADG
jgi:hypothetical protein